MSRAQLDDRPSGELRSSVGVELRSGTGEPPDEEGCLESVFDELFSHVVRHGEAKDASEAPVEEGLGCQRLSEPC